MTIIPSDALRVFAFEGSDVRTLVIDGEPWWVAADVCAVLEIRNVAQAVSYLDDDEKLQVSPNLISSEVATGGRDPWIVNEPGLYSLILKSRKPQAKPFKRWITHEVIPQIRRTGSYGGTLALPTDYEQALVALLSEVRDKKALESKVAALEPAANAWERLASANGDFSVRVSANILNRDPNISTGQNRLFAIIRGLDMVSKGDVPYAKHSEHLRQKPGGAFEHPKTGEKTIGEPQLRVTVRGLQYLHKRLGGVVPLAHHIQAELDFDAQDGAA